VCSTRNFSILFSQFSAFPLVPGLFAKFKLCKFCSQIDVAGNRKAIVIYVPYRLRKAYRKIHLRLVRELEKKFSGKVNVISDS